MANQTPGRTDSPFINYLLLNPSQNGSITKKDISSLGPYQLMGLINLNNLQRPVSLKRMEVRMGLKWTTMIITLL
jgi:hypothetical protein